MACDGWLRCRNGLNLAESFLGLNLKNVIVPGFAEVATGPLRDLFWILVHVDDAARLR